MSFWPRVRARALRAPVFLGSLTRQTGRCAPPPATAASLLPQKKIKKFQKQNTSLLARTYAARGVYLSTGLSCTLVSYIAPAPSWFTLHPPELRCTLMSYTTPYWATWRPAKLCCNQLSYAASSELSCTLLSYAVPFWATVHPSELRCTLSELRCALRTTLLPLDKLGTSELRYSLLRYAACILLSYTVHYWVMPHPKWATRHPKKFIVPRPSQLHWFLRRN